MYKGPIFNIIISSVSLFTFVFFMLECSTFLMSALIQSSYKNLLVFKSIPTNVMSPPSPPLPSTMGDSCTSTHCNFKLFQVWNQKRKDLISLQNILFLSIHSTFIDPTYSYSHTSTHLTFVLLSLIAILCFHLILILT